MAAPIAKTSFARGLGTEMVSIYVGKERKQFFVHKALLTSQSDYFHKALGGKFKEAEENKIVLEEEDPIAVELLVAFLYLGVIPRPGAGQSLSQPLTALFPVEIDNLSPLTAPTSTGTSMPFRPIGILDPNQTTNANMHLHICCDVSYRHFSPEELRLADYSLDRKYGGAAAIAQSELPPLGPVPDTPEVYQLHLPPVATPPGNLQEILSGPTTPQIPTGSQSALSLGGAPVSTRTPIGPSSAQAPSVSFGYATPLSNPLSIAASSNPPNAPSTPISTPIATPPPFNQPSVSAAAARTPLSSTPSSSVPTTPRSAQIVDAASTGFARWAKPSSFGIPVFGRPATPTSIPSSPWPSASGTSVFGSPAAKPSNVSALVPATPNLSNLTQTGSSLAPNSAVPIKSSVLARLPRRPSIELPTQDPALPPADFSSSHFIIYPEPEGNFIEGIPRSEYIGNILEEELAYQDAFLHLCILAETFCWPNLFNAAIDAYIQGERSLHRDISVQHIDTIYERTHSKSPLREFVMDSMRELKNDVIIRKEYADLVYTHEDFLQAILSRLSTANVEREVLKFGPTKLKDYHMTEEIARSVNLGSENIITAQPISKNKLNLMLSDTFASRSHKQFDKIVVGGIISRDGGQRILIIKRAAHRKYYPNMFELPGGKVYPTDASLADALVREVKEETGLTVTSVVKEVFSPLYYETSKTVDGAVVRKSCVQLNFIVNVKHDEVKLNPDEHSEAMWATMDDLANMEGEMSEEIRCLPPRALPFVQQ